MAIDRDRATKHFDKLRKSLRNLPKHPSPKQVHSLRTSIRRAEAILDVLIVGKNSDKNCLRNAIKPVRKKAGHVRDMDVLIAFTAKLSKEIDDLCVVQLIEHLSRERIRSANKLLKTFSKTKKPARRCLKECSYLVEIQFSAAKKRKHAIHEIPAEALTHAYSLWMDLSEWPQLTAENLHPFRLKVKELRYVLQLFSNQDKGFIGALGRAKDAIGEWHDWHALSMVAVDILKNHADCPLAMKIRSATKQKLHQALSVSNAMRKKYQPGQFDHGHTHRKSRRSSPTGGWRQVRLPQHLLAKG